MRNKIQNHPQKLFVVAIGIAPIPLSALSPIPDPSTFHLDLVGAFAINCKTKPIRHLIDLDYKSTTEGKAKRTTSTTGNTNFSLSGTFRSVPLPAFWLACRFDKRFFGFGCVFDFVDVAI